MITKAQVKLVRSLKEKKFRDETGLFVAEGDKCINELKKGFELVLYCNQENATKTEIEQMSSMRCSQGSIGVFRKREDGIWNMEDGICNMEEELVLALDGVQDPGNMGTIIRTADWFGVRRIVCSKDTADCYNPKVVQATMGALARVRVEYVEELAKWLEEARGTRREAIGEGWEIYGTLLEGEDMWGEAIGDRRQVIGDRRQAIVVMGNEGKGISEEVRKVITRPIRIPSYPKDAETSESLNVAIATGIVLAEFRRCEMG